MKEIAPTYALLGLAVFWLGSLLVIRLWKTPGWNREEYLVAGRNKGLFPAAASIAANWVWAPALFLAARQAYVYGVTGLFWFLVPNMLALALFAPFAAKIHSLAPQGFTLSHFMAGVYSTRVQKAYALQLGSLALCAFAVQLVAGGELLAVLTGLPAGLFKIILACIAFSYAFSGGLSGSMRVNACHMAMLIIVSAATLFALEQAAELPGQTDGTVVFLKGLGGISGAYGDMFSAQGLRVALEYGLPMTIGLLSGPFGDQSFYQRAFSVRPALVRSAFYLSAVLFGMVPLALSGLGFAAAGLGLETAVPDMINVEVISRLLPQWALYIFACMILCGLLSTLDAHLCAASSLGGHDAALAWFERIGRLGQAVGPEAFSALCKKFSRLSMLVFALCGTLLACLPGITLMHLFLFYGVVRSTTFLPTVLTLLGLRLPEPAVFYGILGGMALGLPLFVLGKLSPHLDFLAIAGSLLAILFPLALYCLIRCFCNQRRGEKKIA